MKREAKNKKPRAKPTREEETNFTKEESERIIDLFAVDGGNYP